MSIGLKRGTVCLEKHQKAWEDSAEQTIAEIQNALDGIDADVQHVGSTSIKSIKAKPIIDIAVGVPDFESVSARNDKLKKVCIFPASWGFDDHPEELLYVKGDFEKDTRTHHIHVVLKTSKEWKNYLNFRDFLNATPSAAREYEAVKDKLEAMYPDNREKYTAGKSEIIAKLLEEAEKWREVTRLELCENTCGATRAGICENVRQDVRQFQGQDMRFGSTIVEVDETNVFDAARIHSVSWQESHRAFCKADFVALHTPERQREYLLGKLKNGYKLYMLLDAEPVGIVAVKESLIEDLYVLPEKQNKGYGSALLEFACTKCAGTPTLWILENNVNAARLYRRKGFTETGHKNVVTNGLDEIEFAKH
ncbi:MAG: GNAT family N-acetyltransferase [Treponemataceae bacterium]|nr:GNAT family N-acetyltransferase [Treponemataceae bacterium]